MRALLAALVILAAGRAGAQEPAVPITFATFYTAESESAAVTAGTTIEALIADAFATYQGVLDSATVGSARVVAIVYPPVRLELQETGVCTADRDQFFASARAHAVRDSLRANVAVLFPERCSQTFQCVEGSPSCESHAFALAQAPYAGASRHALAHEVGHLFGMRHNVENDPTPGDGHAFLSEPDSVFTVVSQRGSLPRESIVPYYSDPRRTVRGVRIGVEGQANNAALLRRVAPAVARWNENPLTAEPEPGAGPSVRVDPNPTGSAWRLTFAVPAPSPLDVDLLDARGRRVGGFVLAVGETHLDLPASGLAPGVYLLRLTGPDGRARTVRLTRSP